jgi:hypothetical protein
MVMLILLAVLLSPTPAFAASTKSLAHIQASQLTPGITGIGAVFSFHRTPVVKDRDGWSLTQLLISNGTSTIEFGWIVCSTGNCAGHNGRPVDPYLFLAIRTLASDKMPQFISQNGQHGFHTYTGPGGTMAPNSRIAPGDWFFSIEYLARGSTIGGSNLTGLYTTERDGWWMNYNGVWLGVIDANYFAPDNFRSGRLEAWYGEVGSNDTVGPCTQMGTGFYADDPTPGAGSHNAAQISDMFLTRYDPTVGHGVGVPAAPTIEPYDAPSRPFNPYTAMPGPGSVVTASWGFSYGGPGFCLR